MIKLSLACPYCNHESSFTFNISMEVSKIESQTDEQSILGLPLRDITWPYQNTRIKGSLIAKDLRTLGDLTQKTEGELLRTPNFGKVSLDAIKEKLEELGLRLKEKVW